MFELNKQLIQLTRNIKNFKGLKKNLLQDLSKFKSTLIIDMQIISFYSMIYRASFKNEKQKKTCILQP